MKNAGAITFRPTLWPTFATLVLLPTLLALGFWQLDRAEEKRQLLAEFEARGSETVPFTSGETQNLRRYQRVSVQGRYDVRRQFLLDAMPGSGGAGYHVVDVFLPDGSDTALLVDRGWIPVGDDRSVLPDRAAPQGRQALSGRLQTLPRPGLELAGGDPGTGEWPRVVLFPTIDELEQAAGTELFPMLLWLDPNLADGFERDWRPVSGGPDRHIAYAVQWFGLAAALLVIFIVVNVQRGTDGSANAG
ncbi:MAG: SURF1 family protein [Gammaproteobacteria bacterium]|nr:SURF1 family protein [Gammaproteobacteria bacterium]